MDGLTRLSVNLNKETADALKDIADSKGMTFTETVRRCIAVYKFIEDERLEGNRMYVIDENKNEQREIILL